MARLKEVSEISRSLRAFVEAAYSPFLPRFSTRVHSPTTVACRVATKGQKTQQPASTNPALTIPGSTSCDSRFTATATLDSMSRIVMLMHLPFDDAAPPSRARLHGGTGLCPPDRARCGDEDARRRAS